MSFYTASEISLNSAQTAAPEFNRLLLHCPEITLKGKNRTEFQNRLCTNTIRTLASVGLDWPVRPSHGRIYVHVPARQIEHLPQAVEALRCLTGIVSVSPAIRIAALSKAAKDCGSPTPTPVPDTTAIGQNLLSLARLYYQPRESFAVRVNRVDKRVRVNSVALESELGALLREHSPFDRVDLRHSDRRFVVDIYPDGIYLHAQRHLGVGGLPAGASGHGLVLLSGGIDSPVAAVQMAKRGCSLDFIHMTPGHAFFDQAEQSVVARLAARLSRYTLRSRLYLVPYSYLDLAMLGKQTRYHLMIFRRFLSRCAQQLAQDLGAEVLITGDSLGQVASQTLSNLITQEAATQMPVFRPLIGLNKQEIIDVARQIGTYDLSTEPYKDCCALIAQQPKTLSSPERLARYEAYLLRDYQALLQQTIADCVCLEYELGSLISKKDLRGSATTEQVFE